MYYFIVLCARGGFSSRCGQSSFARHRVQFSVAMRDSAGAPRCAGVANSDGIVPPSTIPTAPTARRPVNAAEHTLSVSARFRRRPDDRRRIAVYHRQCWLCSLLYLSTLRASFRPCPPFRRHRLSTRFLKYILQNSSKFSSATVNIPASARGFSRPTISYLLPTQILDVKVYFNLRKKTQLKAD